MKQSEKYGFPIYEDEDNVELDKYTEELTEKLEDLEDTDREEINNIYKDVQASKIHYETEQAKSLYIDDATDSRGKISVEGNVEQETILYNGALEQGSLSASGTDVDASNRIRTADYIEVKENTEIKVLADGANQYLLAFFSTSKEYMSGSDWTNLGTGITIIASAKYAKVILRKTDNSTINVADISNFVVGDTPSINYPSKLQCLGSNKNLFNKKTTTDNMQINTNGSITPIPDVMCSDFIEVKEGKYYTLSGRTSYENFRKYDNDKNFLGTITAKNNGTVLISEGCKYIRFNALMKNKDKIKLEEGETATSYSPYRTR